MSRLRRVRAAMTRTARTSAPDRSGGEPAGSDTGKVAEDIGAAALELATRANAAGMTTLGFLLESVALEAGAEAVTRRWPPDAAKS